MMLEMKTTDAFESLMANPYRTLKTHNITAKGGSITYRGANENAQHVCMVDDYFITSHNLHDSQCDFRRTYPPSWHAFLAKLLEERNGVHRGPWARIWQKRIDLNDIVERHLISRFGNVNRRELWPWYWEGIYTHQARKLTDDMTKWESESSLEIKSPNYLIGDRASSIYVSGNSDIFSKLKTIESVFSYVAHPLPKPFGMDFTKENIHKISALHEIAEQTLKNWSIDYQEQTKNE